MPVKTRRMRRNLAADAPAAKWSTTGPAANVSMTIKLWKDNKIVNTVATSGPVGDWSKVYEAAVPPELKEVRNCSNRVTAGVTQLLVVIIGSPTQAVTTTGVWNSRSCIGKVAVPVQVRAVYLGDIVQDKAIPGASCDVSTYLAGPRAQLSPFVNLVAEVCSCYKFSLRVSAAQCNKAMQ